MEDRNDDTDTYGQKMPEPQGLIDDVFGMLSKEREKRSMHLKKARAEFEMAERAYDEITRIHESIVAARHPNPGVG